MAGRLLKIIAMKAAELINELVKSRSCASLLQVPEVQEYHLRELLREHFPRLGLTDKPALLPYLADEVLFEKLQRLFEAHQEIASRVESIEQQFSQRLRVGTEEGLGGKKVTRAALARRLEKNKEEMRKDQIFVRLIPRSQACIQFMLGNRNFPRMEVKLSCNQHLEYLINYLANKWIRGKAGFKIALYPDPATFLKTVLPAEREKAVREPFNNYLMFTDLMDSCGVHQNGVLNLCYEILGDPKKQGKADSQKPEPQKAEQVERGEKGSPPVAREREQAPRLSTPSKSLVRDPEASLFNRNSNFFPNNEESALFSLGFNFNFNNGTPAKREDLLSINSLNYMDIHHHEQRNDDRDSPLRDRNERPTAQHERVLEVNESACEQSSPECRSEEKPQEPRGEAQGEPRNEGSPQGDARNESQAGESRRLPLKNTQEIVELIARIDRDSGSAFPEGQSALAVHAKPIKEVSIVKKKTNPQ